jgi:hypothetical protein
MTKVKSSEEINANIATLKALARVNDWRISRESLGMLHEFLEHEGYMLGDSTEEAFKEFAEDNPEMMWVFRKDGTTLAYGEDGSHCDYYDVRQLEPDTFEQKWLEICVEDLYSGNPLKLYNSKRGIIRVSREELKIERGPQIVKVITFVKDDETLLQELRQATTYRGDLIGRLYIEDGYLCIEADDKANMGIIQYSLTQTFAIIRGSDLSIKILYQLPRGIKEAYVYLGDEVVVWSSGPLDVKEVQNILLTESYRDTPLDLYELRIPLRFRN